MSLSKENLYSFLKENIPLEFALLACKIYARFAANDKNDWSKIYEVDALNRSITQCFNKRGEGWLTLMTKIEEFYHKFSEKAIENFLLSRCGEKLGEPVSFRLGEPNIFNRPAIMDLAYELHMAVEMYHRLAMKVGLCKQPPMREARPTPESERKDFIHRMEEKYNLPSTKPLPLANKPPTTLPPKRPVIIRPPVNSPPPLSFAVPKKAIPSYTPPKIIVLGKKTCPPAPVRKEDPLHSLAMAALYEPEKFPCFTPLRAMANKREREEKKIKEEPADKKSKQ